ncbi:thermonuclease family protein [Dyadobacter aurulentus]|uniref:thermonuclease family protein n=1 Tax=Dyadobacter sp. UC 10 TaxID=2605428 RepID=UPI001CECB21D|nr:thermonuclease family protein [Dyadobacter sp. UC 10]
MHSFFKLTLGKLSFLICFFAVTAFVNNSHSGDSYIQQPGLPNPLRAEVIGIQDGDTIELKFIYSGNKAGRRSGKPIRIRLLHVNSPERGQPFYKVAKQFTSDNSFRKTVQVRHAGNFDKYGRLLGEVILPDGRVLNKELVKKGLAVHFKKYSTSTEYANLEIQARKKRLGVWKVQDYSVGKL